MRRTLTIILLLTLPFLCSGFVSTNVPLDHWSYNAIDKLVGQGLIDSAMMTTKPFSRLEMARLITEAAEKVQQLNEKNKIILAILDRLKNEFKDELITTGLLDDAPVENFIKPVEDPYARYILIDEKPDFENQRGDVFEKHSNYRLGFVSRMKFFDTLAFYLHPEYADSSSNTDSSFDLIEGYGKLTFGNMEIELGKDSLWWGPGYHGSILMSNNIKPFEMLKISNPRPVQLPWIFRGLGPFKAVWFLTKLEKGRTIPEAKLTGLRINFKPNPGFEIGLSRTIMFGGSGRASLGLKDYWDIFWAGKENKPGKLDNNQLAGADVSVLVPLDDNILVKSIKLYADLAGEDEADGWPSNWGKLFGAQFNDILRTGRTDLRIEYANNHISGKPNIFYNHGVYKSGYTYKGRIIGHHMGTDARDLFVRLNHYLTENIILGFEFDREVKGLSAATRQSTDKFGLDITFFGLDNFELRTGYRYEHAENSSFVPGNTQNDHIFHLQLTRDF